MLYDEALRKDYNELLESAIEKLREKTGLTDFSAGSVARSILEVVYDDIYLLYNDLATVATKYFLPNATGQYLDELSKLFGMERLPGESDTNFRYRISRWTQDKAKANETAIRFACLSVEGVHDIIIKKYVRVPEPLMSMSSQMTHRPPNIYLMRSREKLMRPRQSA